MTHKMKHIKYISFVLLLVAVAACTKTTTNPTVQDEPKTEDPPPSKIELLVKAWNIDTAYHDGVKDASSTGKDMVFHANGSYTFDDYLNGTWSFTPDSTKILIDENLTYPQDWSIQELSETRLDVTFNSPFTGKPSQWIMHVK